MPLVAVKSTPEANRRNFLQCPNDQFASVSDNSAMAWKSGYRGVGYGDLGIAVVEAFGEIGEAGAADDSYFREGYGFGLEEGFEVGSGVAVGQVGWIEWR